VFLEMQHKNLEEAHMLDLNAVSLDPGNLRYRLNTASILMQMEHGKDAIAVLQNATKLASSPEEVNSVQNLLESAQQYQAAREQMEQDRQVSRGVQSTFPQAEATLGDAKQLGSLPQALPPPKDEPHGPRRSVKGTIRNVQCSLPAIMRLKVEAEGKTISLRSNNYFKIPFTAVGFTPAGELHPCTELEGMKAHVEFFEASEKAAEGLIFFVELSK
jgi:hypothetical protein